MSQLKAVSEPTIVFETSSTTHWRNLFPNKSMLLGSHNLNEGEEIVCEISAVSIQAIKDKKGGEEQVPVVRFKNAPPMVLNITNTRTIAALYGDRYDNWCGRSIQLYATTVKAFGSTTTALRVRPQIPASACGESRSHDQALRDCASLEDLKRVFMAIPKHIQPQLVAIKDEMKRKLS